MNVAKAVHEVLSARGFKLALAESCTGGMIAQQLTAFSGASNYLLGSLVAYSNAWKEEFLGVSANTVETKGAVSREVVVEMLKGLFARTQADYALAVSGIAGPLGGSEEKPVGTIWAALGRRGETPVAWTFHIEGNRETVIRGATAHLLEALLKKVENDIRST